MDSSYGKPYFPGKRRCILGEGAEEAEMRPLSGGEAFSCQCRVSPKGKVMEKIETGPLGRDVFNYEYDAAGHLTMVRKNELISEFYEFDEGGRRVLDFRAWAGGKRRLTYNYDGTLIQAGNVHLKWTEQGQLAAIEEDGRRTSFYYGHDTRLDRALLADGTDIRYHYGNELMPVKITVNGATVAEYQWADKIRLLRYRDARRGLSHDFLYADKRAPVKVIISGSAVDLYQGTGISAQRLELDIQTDQVDSIRALSLPDGRPVKYIEYDSFGNVISDNRPDWQFPLGFACGLNDPWTGLIRFGFRDYDPRFGRFTAKDPARDMRGDGDLWDYCIDDPVGSFDPTGLWTKDNFDESKISRDDRGRFGSGSATERAAAYGEQGLFSGPGDIYADAYRSSLGVYRGSEVGIYNNHPVIFTHTGDAPHQGTDALAGAFVPDKGILGTLATAAHKQGQPQIVVYGDPKTGKPSSWSYYEWQETGKKIGAAQWPEFGWMRVPTEKEALGRPGFQDMLNAFTVKNR